MLTFAVSKGKAEKTGRPKEKNIVGQKMNATSNGKPLSAGRNDYTEILRHAVAVIERARTQIAKHVSVTVASAYWEIGKLLHERKIESGHGESVVRRLSDDLKERYPRMGVSTRQLWNMKKFYLRYAGHNEKLLRSVALLPWSHNLLILNKDLDDDATSYYAAEVLAKGWNRDLLLNAIKMNMYEAQKAATADNNFLRTLPAEQASYANEVFRSSYNLGFLGVTSRILELELEARLVKAITRFLMELGNGFTFIGNQHILEYNGKESKVDMLFFHRGLRCLVAIDLKIGAFKPEYAGKMNIFAKPNEQSEACFGSAVARKWARKRISICRCSTALSVARAKTAPSASSSAQRKTTWKWNSPSKTWANQSA